MRFLIGILILLARVGVVAAADLSIGFQAGLPAPRLQTTVVVGSRPTVVTSLDINGNGPTDFVAANYGGNTVTIMKNLSNGDFLATQEILVRGESGSSRGGRSVGPRRF